MFRSGGFRAGSVPALPGRSFISTWYYPPMHTSADSTNALTQDVEYAVRFEVGVATTFDRIGIEVTTNIATAVVRLGIRYDTGFCTPDVLLLDAGTIDAATNGFKAATISQLLPPGRWWLTATVQVTTGVSVRSRAVDPFISQATTTTTFNAGAFSNNSGKSGALPAAFGSPSASSAGPKILMRAA